MTTFDRLNDANALPEGAVLVSENGAYFATLQRYNIMITLVMEL